MSEDQRRSSLVVIHPYVDLDACACVAFSGARLEDVRFVPGHITERPEPLKDARFLDHPLGHKGQQDAQGFVHAASVAMPEVADLADSPLLQEIDSQDAFGWSLPRYNLATLITALRLEFKSQGLEGESLDRAILGCMVPILRGLARLERQRRTGRPITVAVGSWRFILRVEDASLEEAVGPGDVPSGEDETLVVGVIYHEGYNLGIARFAPFSEPDFRPLRPYLPGWFIHPAGFLACWGSNKAPRSEPPPPGTPQNWRELLSLVRQVLEAEPRDI